ncbi:DUF3108 domain-containing protein [Acinetobacter sp. c2-A9]|uniref:DUF3108 domain-containing protein n=1 Tax=Acinetobacter sp. c2-A9 TaxID=3342802 RepID=UPI0035BB0684
MKKLSTLAVIAGLSLSVISQAHAIAPFLATYQFSYNGKTLGDATRVLTQQGGNQWQYQFSARIPMIGQATETSRFSMSNTGQIQSQSYRRQTKILVHSDTVSIDFLPQQNRINTNRKGQARSLTWRAGALDDLNAELQIREDLKKGGLKSNYVISSYDSVDNRQFVREGSERVQSATGQAYDTVRVRLRHSNPQKATIFWLAPALDYLPVKVTHQDDGNSYSLLLKR